MFYKKNPRLAAKKLIEESIKLSKKKNFFKYLKTTHAFHIVDPSPWPILAAIAAFTLACGITAYMHKTIGGWFGLKLGVGFIIFVMFAWWRDVIREAMFENSHTAIVRRGLRLGMILFIVSEIMFFFAFFWAFFHSSIAPSHAIGGVWPPKAITPINICTIPLLNTLLLLTSGASITWAHHSICTGSKRHALLALIITQFLAVFFTCLQAYEYLNAPFSISDGIYGSCFFMTTGFHGFHVIIGLIAISVSFIRLILNHFTTTRHFGFECALWYWHFVDVVWLFLFATVYWWSNLM